ncbi:hypothetical protein SmJEL517_g05284 [Synchytrium microbalum]|uniref:3-oxoacyl-[acyl-carrier-protein] reductase n=1 Tax=Synchytrium microbalum TaxID=1806994 RepID=A0A507BZY1_9FUNG|nr:uncharacterized protein SmJEL517_g05284 [Synchytrium microbalum]TPX31354.1 hypothetical protein SmJEL517_g05284 [Synchytrium microbalum]
MSQTDTLTTSRLAGKVCIITGCNSAIGIGAASALYFAKSSAAAIYITDVNTSNLPALASLITKNYKQTKVHIQKVDSGNPKDVASVVDAALAEYGRLDVFFANAGVPGQGYGFDVTEQDFMEVMRVNAYGPFLGIKEGSRGMLVTSASKPKSGGSIIMTASIAGLKAHAGGPPYSAAKAGVISLAQTGAHTLAGTNIRCNAVCPGLIATEMIKTGVGAEIFQLGVPGSLASKLNDLNPLKRHAEPSEVAAVVTFLASEEAGFVNGQAIPVCGGASSSVPFVETALL